MTLQERKQALETARQHWQQGVILNNISSCCLADCLALLEHSQQRVSTAEVRLRACLAHVCWARPVAEGLLRS